MSDFHGDIVVACADLVGRAGASEFEIGYLHDDVPVEQAGWYAHAKYRGVRLTADDRKSPSEAAMALAERILRGGMCRCKKLVTLDDSAPGLQYCRWRLVGKRWEPGCSAPPIKISGARGDVAAIQRAMKESK